MKLGLPLTECMEKTTHRQYEAWSEWLSEDYNRPERSDYYSMLIAAEVRGLTHAVVKVILGKSLGDISLEDFLLRFTSKSPEEKIDQTAEEGGADGGRDDRGDGLDRRFRKGRRDGRDERPTEHRRQHTPPSPFLQEKIAERAAKDRAGLLRLLKNVPGVKVTEPCVPADPVNPIPEKYRKLQKHYRPEQ